MGKIKYYVLCALCVIACTQEIPSESGIAEQKEEAFKEIVITANREVTTKTTYGIDNSKLIVRWEEGDEIGVSIGGGSFMAFKQTGDISSDGHTAFFRGLVPASLEGDVIAIYPFHSEGVFDLSQQSGILDKMKVTDVMKAEGSLSGNRISKLSFQPLTTIIRIPAETIYPESGIEGQVAFSFSGASVGNKITVSPSGTISVEVGSVTFPAMLSNSSFVTDVAFNFIPKTSGLDELEYSLQRDGGNPYSFSRKSIDVGKMYNLKRFEDPWEFVISARDPDDLSWSGGISETAHVLSYKERNGVQIPVGWSIEGYYSDEECTVSLTQPTWITAITTQGSGSVSEGETLSITYSTGNAVQSSRTDLAETANSAIASSSFGAGSSPSNYLNISNPLEMSSSTVIESANSYIVNGPGYYRIPLVMGNGFLNGSSNPESASYRGSDATNCRMFLDYKGQQVESPVLHKSNTVEGFAPGTPSSAFVVWEDVNGLVEVLDNTEYVLSGTPIIFDDTQDLYWLNLHVNQSEQGNAVIAVTDEKGMVMWSYHIWVTNYIPHNYNGYGESSFRNIQVVPFEEQYHYNMMPINLGWISTGAANSTVYEENSVYIRVVQDESGKTAVIRVHQLGNEILSIEGRCPYYQWGRKDAMIPSNGEKNGARAVCYGRNSIFSHVDEQVTFDVAICNPGIFYAYAGAWHKGQGAFNLWDAGCSNTDLSYNTVKKTIYDPCPAGYCMPPSGAFTGTTKTGSRVLSNKSQYNVLGNYDKGWFFYSDKSKTNVLYFPAAGRLKYYPGTQEYVQTQGFYWTAHPNEESSGLRGRHFFFYGSEVAPTGNGNRASGFVVRPVEIE